MSDESRQEDACRWRLTLWSMVGIQFVMSLALTVIGPILPVFLPVLGVEDHGAIELWAGILNSCGFLIAAFASPLWGRLGDRSGRKLMVIRSSLAICVFTALMGLSQNVWQLFALRTLMGAFSGFSATAIALVASQVPGNRLGMALGWLATGQLTGALMGPVARGVLADWTGSYRIAFFWTSVLAGSALLLAWLLVPDSAVPASSGKPTPSLLASVRVVGRTSGLLPLLLVLLLAQFSTRAVLPVITLFVQDLVGGHPDLTTLAGVAFSVTGLADLVASPFLGKRSDTAGYRRTLLICLCGATLATLPQAFAQSYAAFVIERFGVGVFIGGVLPTANALVGRLTPAADRGFVYGLTASATFFGSFLGPLTGGTVASLFGIRWVFVVTAIVMSANALWVLAAVAEPADLPASAD